MFERRHEPLLPLRLFLLRMMQSGGAAVAIVAVSLAGGAIGYHYTEALPWLDATLNASMILTGMGPVAELHTRAAKIFAIAYSLFSGVVFLTVAALILAPLAHRVLHRFHIDES